VERIADLTGSEALPELKRLAYRHCRDKFGAAGLTPVASLRVRPPRVAECPLQLESRVERMALDASGEFYIVQATVVTVHADPKIVVPGTSHIDPRQWSPLIYNFRHYFALALLIQ
jgi:flavin reductase (DIM6/NTAB) family NADH-FMN oxidoreductase RutF